MSLPTRKITIRASWLDSWRYFREADWLTEEEMIERILGKPAGPVAQRRMDLGTDFHTYMAGTIARGTHQWESPYADIQPDNFFDTEGLDWELPLDQPEIEKRGITYIPVLDVNLTGQVDLMEGQRIWEWKTTQRGIDVEGYYHAMQWRAYLYLFGASRITYGVAQLKQVNDSRWKVIDSMMFSLHPYGGMRLELFEVIDDLATWIRNQDRLRGIL